LRVIAQSLHDQCAGSDHWTSRKRVLAGVSFRCTAKVGDAAWIVNNFNFFGTNLVRLQYAAKPLLNLRHVALDQNDTASGGPLANVLEQCVFCGKVKGFKDAVNKWGQSVGKACSCYALRNRNIFRLI
jgi:hypothetical protein